MNWKVIFYIYLIFSFVSISFSSCTEEAPPSLTYKDRKLVDSLFTDTATVLKTEIDSLCDLQFEEMVAHFRDSIYEEQIKDMEKQRMRNEKLINENKN